jgi:hypothetical protein
MSEDDIEFTGRVRLPQNQTSARRRYLSTTVRETIDLRRILDHAQRLLDVLTNVNLTFQYLSVRYIYEFTDWAC